MARNVMFNDAFGGLVNAEQSSAPQGSRILVQRRRWVLGLTASATVASVTGLVGMVLAAVSLLRIIPADSRLGNYGVVLLVVTFPLMFAAAHCLDKIDEVNRAIQEAGMPEDERDRWWK